MASEVKVILNLILSNSVRVLTLAATVCTVDVNFPLLPHVF